jgi:hypothetical protein
MLAVTVSELFSDEKTWSMIWRVISCRTFPVVYQLLLLKPYNISDALMHKNSISAL